MRQPTNDFRIDPFQSITGKAIAAPKMTPEMSAHHAKFNANQVIYSAYNFCGKACLNLGAAKMSDAEQVCLDGCKASYMSSLKLLNAEEGKFNGLLKDIQLNGGDIYEARDI